MLMAGRELHELVDAGILDVKDRSLINAASIDLTLGNTIMVEQKPVGDDRVHPGRKESPLFTEVNIDTQPYMLQPGQFVLAHANEKFNLPDNISAEFKLKSSQGRCGLNHALCGWADAGFSGHLTLEFHNISQYHNIVLESRMKCGQVIFYRHAHVPEDQSYRMKGSYNGSEGVTTADRK